MKKELGPDMSVPCGDGIVNIRVGAIIRKDGKILMAKNARANYCYSVGGRIRMHETAEEAIVRECLEETGVALSVKRLAFVHENYFYGDTATNLGKLIYELSIYYEMNVPDGFEPVCMSFAEDGVREQLVWIDPHGDMRYYPEFFRTALDDPKQSVRFFTNDERS